MLYYVTGNKNKIAIAQRYLSPLGISITPQALELEEIQSHDIEQIAIHKAKHAFGILQKPLFVNDHGWSFTALNGFPGAYMKYMNEWFTPEDFLHLMQGKENREAILTEVICYIDGHNLKTFSIQHKGEVLHEVQGKGLAATTVTTLSSDRQSIAKKLETNVTSVETYTIWEEFAQWYKEEIKKQLY